MNSGEKTAFMVLLQLLESNDSSGMLVASGPQGTGRLWFRDGVIVGAQAGEYDGEDAALTLIWQSQGQFHFDFEPRSVTDDEAETEIAVAELLDDEAWMREELRRLGRNAPVYDDLVAVKDARAAAACLPALPAWSELLAQPAEEPQSVEEIARAIGIGVHRFRALLVRCVEQGAIELM